MQCLVERGITGGSIILPNDTATGNIEVNNRVTAAIEAIVAGLTKADLGVLPAILACVAAGTAIGVVNGVLVTLLRVPALIATLTMLLIGRGMVLGLTGGRSVNYPMKADGYA